MTFIFVSAQFVTANTDVDPILQAAINTITIPNVGAVRGNITLPITDANSITYTWTSSDSTIIKASQSTGYIGYSAMPAGIVNRQSTDTIVTLTVTESRNGILSSRLINVTIKAKVVKSEDVGYLYAYFSGNERRLDNQQIYFAISKDGVKWSDLNKNNPVLTSKSGDFGVRDPYIVRSVE